MSSFIVLVASPASASANWHGSARVNQSTVSRAERGLLRALRLELVAAMLWCVRGSFRP